MPNIETTNDQLVSASKNDIVVMLPKLRMTRKEALRQAAWLVALAGGPDEFKPVLEAVLST